MRDDRPHERFGSRAGEPVAEVPGPLRPAQTPQAILRTSQLTAAVVLATRDRRDDLVRCLEALHSQTEKALVEILVVDDGSVLPVDARELQGVFPVRVLRTEGVGPAAARNTGARAVMADIVVFTDDDTIPVAGWVAAAMSRLREHPEEVAVEGPVESPAYDPLYAYSVHTHAPGHHWTCNIAYRRAILDRVGGFAEDVFPYAHCEDLDLAYRAMAFGRIGFSTGMSIMHTPRATGMMDFIRRGRWAASELELARRHPARVPRSRLPVVLPRTFELAFGHARNWQRRWRADRARLIRDPGRMARFVTIAVGHTVVASATALAHARRMSREDADPFRGPSKPSSPRTMITALRQRSTLIDSAILATPTQRVVRAMRRRDVLADPLRFTALEFFGHQDRAAVHRLRGSSVRVALRHRSRDVDIFDEVWSGRQGYEPPKELAHLLTNGMSVLDLGGNVGLFGAFVLYRFPGSRLTSVEPDPHNLPVIKRCIRDNEGHWTLLPVCASTHRHQVSLDGGRYADSRITVESCAHAVEVSAIDVFPLINDCAFVKMDIEGSEWPILLDPRFGRVTPSVFVLEWHQDGCPDEDGCNAALAAFHGAGYRTIGEATGYPHGVIWAWRE
jgi:FkbM family methyltransferase